MERETMRECGRGWSRRRKKRENQIKNKDGALDLQQITEVNHRRSRRRIYLPAFVCL